MANDERDELKDAVARHVAEEAVLDRVLALAPREGAIGHSALAARIAAAAKAEIRPSASEARGNVVPMRPRLGSIPQVARPGVWRAVAALAASLVLGILGGASSIGEPALSGIFEIAGLDVTNADTGVGEDWEEFPLDNATSLEELL